MGEGVEEVGDGGEDWPWIWGWWEGWSLGFHFLDDDGGDDEQ